MDIGDMDVEDFQREWRRARDAWTRASQHKLERDAAGQQLTDQERSDWQAARDRFDEYERAWDEIRKLGVVVLVEGDDEEDDEPGPA